jgi:hypothetical protein
MTRVVRPLPARVHSHPLDFAWDQIWIGNYGWYAEFIFTVRGASSVQKKKEKKRLGHIRHPGPRCSDELLLIRWEKMTVVLDLEFFLAAFTGRQEWRCCSRWSRQDF